MKCILIFLILACGNLSYSQDTTETAGKTTRNPNYDKDLAEELGGDEYGMKKYYFVILKTGSNTTSNQELIQESFRGHLQNINELVEKGKLVVVGPLAANDLNYRGIFILSNVNSHEEALQLLKTDLAVENNLLDVEIFEWYGSAALPTYLLASDKIWRQKP